jgi:uncharacterized damage-inducible protein DinB
MQAYPFNALPQHYNLQETDLSPVRDMFASLFKWNNEANEQFIITLKKIIHTPPACLEILSHVINVHELWINRITNIRDSEIQPWDKLGKIDLTLKNANNYYVTLGLLASEGYGRNFKWSFDYVDPDGTKITSNLSDAYFHILSHSSYHRGQIAYVLREHKITPPDTNFIILKNGMINSCG